MNAKVNEGKLISGKDALIALANGEEVEVSHPHDKWYEGWESLNSPGGKFFLLYLLDETTGYKFRIKPCTITLNGIEVPAPFKPKEGDLYWHISPEYMIGYGTSMYSDGNVDTWQQFGAWRTEEEIKQVVAALRQVFGGSHDN